MNDQQISNAITQVVQAANRDCVVYLTPRRRMKPQPELDGARFVRYVLSETDPALDLEIHETATQNHIFINKIGPQDALDALPVAQFNGHYRIPDRVFAPGDDFKDDYYTARYAESYSLYTELCAGIKPASIFEIGVRYGYSAWSMLRSCRAGTVYHGIDIHPASIEHTNAMLHHEYPQHELRLARADSGTLTHLSRSYDLAHVDGNHGHEATIHDIGLCWGRARYILIDDIVGYCTAGSAVNQWLTMHPGVQAVRYDTQTGHVLIGPLSYIANMPAVDRVA